LKTTTAARRRQRILDAAAKLFAELGYSGVHMDMVAAAADLAKPTLYRYFATKEALFLAALEQFLAQVAEDVAQLRRQSDSCEACLRQTVALIFDRIGPLAPALHAVEGQGTELNERSRRTLRAGFRALRSQVAQLVADGINTGEFKPLDAELAALAIVGAVRMTAIVGSPRRKAADLVSDLVLGGLASQGERVQQPNLVTSSITVGAAS